MPEYLYTQMTFMNSFWGSSEIKKNNDYPMNPIYYCDLKNCIDGHITLQISMTGIHPIAN